MDPARRSGAIPVSPGFAEEQELELPELATPPSSTIVDSRTLLIVALAVGVAVSAGLIAQFLTALIALITNIAFYHRISFASSLPGDANLGAGVIFVPIVGALIIGVMARYGSAAIRGHGIPEVMERV